MDSKPPEVLILRAWLEPTARPRLRIRVVAIRPGEPEQQVLSTTVIQQACDAVRNWLTVLEPPGPGEPGGAAGTRRRHRRSESAG